MRTGLRGLALAIGLLGGVSTGFAEPAIRISPACDGQGVKGWLAEDDVRVFFQACETAEGGAAVISRRGRAGRLIELTRVERRGDRIEVRVGSVAISEALAPPDLAAVLAALGTPELRLAGRSLWRALADAGVTRSTHPAALAALAAALAVIEPGAPPPEGPRTEADPDCLGCCGSGCDGCMGCYTQACYEHDRCIRDAINAGSWSPQMRCLHLMMAAAASAWECV